MSVQSGQGRSVPVGADAGAGTGSPRCRPVVPGAGAADRPQETLYIDLHEKFILQIDLNNQFGTLQ